jgi:hypothetical protein
MRTVVMLAGGGLAMAVWPKLPAVAKWAIIIGLIGVSVIEMNKDYWESFNASSVTGGQAAQGDAQTVDLRAVRRDMDDKKKPVSGAAETATVFGGGARASGRRGCGDNHRRRITREGETS